MGLKFDPPEWLIRDYLNQKNKYEESSEGVQTALQNYMTFDQSNRKNALAEQQLAVDKTKLDREGREQFYNYGDVGSLPSGQQQELLNPSQGPATAEGVHPMKSPIIQHFQSFLSENPSGIKGRERQQSNRPQQVPNLINGKPAVFNPGTSTYEIARVVDPTTQTPGESLADPVFTPRVQPPVPAAQSAELGDFENLVQQVGIVKNTFKPEYVGMYDSRMQQLKQTTGFGASEGAATFKASLGAIRNKLLNLLSGAAISPAEYDRLLQQLPNENSGEVDFKAKLNSFEQNLHGVIASRKNSFQQAGYRTQNPIASNQPTSSPIQSRRPSSAPPGKIKVSNGTETLWIDPADAADAAKDGYQ